MFSFAFVKFLSMIDFFFFVHFITNEIYYEWDHIPFVSIREKWTNKKKNIQFVQQKRIMFLNEHGWYKINLKKKKSIRIPKKINLHSLVKIKWRYRRISKTLPSAKKSMEPEIKETTNVRTNQPTTNIK